MCPIYPRLSTYPLHLALKKQQRSLQARKLKVVRWKQRKISVYDLDIKKWQHVEVRSDVYFLPYSRTVYLPKSLDFLNFGGLDDTELEKPFFTNAGASYTLFSITEQDCVVIPKPIRSMVKARGCFSACFLYDFVYAVGGVNIIEGVLTACERYDTLKDSWQEISDLNVPRKNCSVCALTADSLYVFGGTTPDEHMTDVIESYLVSANIWITLPVRMPYNMSFLSTFKVSPFQILIMGGIVEGLSEITKESFVTNQVSIYDIRHPEWDTLGTETNLHLHNATFKIKVSNMEVSLILCSACYQQYFIDGRAKNLFARPILCPQSYAQWNSLQLNILEQKPTQPMRYLPIARSNLSWEFKGGLELWCLCQRYPEVKMVDELSEDFVSVSQPFFNENGSVMLVNEDDSQENPNIITYNINKYLADPRNTLTGDDP